MARETRSHARVASEGPSPTMKRAFCPRGPGRALLHGVMKHPKLVPIVAPKGENDGSRS